MEGLTARTDVSADAIVRLNGVTKEFPGVLALDRVDIELRPGEVHALTGENGSGKSTLAKVIYGAHRPDSGTVEVDGEEVVIRSPGHALELGIVGISQELTLSPSLSVTENILLGRMPRTRFGLDWRAAQRMAREALSELEIEIDERELVGNLSIELQQEVEIARAFAVESRVIILDEATSSLSEAATVGLMRKVQQLREAGVAILMISHRLQELYESASIATVLRDGELVGEVPLPETPERELIRMMVGRELQDLYGRRWVEHGKTVLQAEEVATLDDAMQPTSLSVKSGEILGVAGLVGSGKSEFGKTLAGAIPSTGRVLIDGEEVNLSSPRHAIAAGIGYVPDDRKRSALLPNRSVAHNLSSAWFGKLSRWGIGLDVRAEERLVADAISRFNIVTSSAEAPIQNLSGGNQQKVVLGRWFLLGVRVLVLNEPTRGIDVGAKRDVYRHIQRTAESGAAVVMISSELPELIGVAHRIAVMFRGRLVGELASDDATEEELAHLAVAGTATRRSEVAS